MTTPNNDTTPSPLDVARDAAQASVEVLLEQDRARLQELEAEYAAATDVFRQARDKYWGLESRVKQLRLDIKRREKFGKGIRELKIKVKDPGACVA